MFFKCVIGFGRDTFGKEYRSKRADCRHCPIKEQCCKKMKYKRITHSIDKQYYDKAYKLINSIAGRQRIRLRSATVEPVWGTLLNFRRMRKVYTKGNELANKQLLMAAMAYNLKKLMNFDRRKSVSNALKNAISNLKIMVFNQIFLFYNFIMFGSNYKITKI